MTRVGDAAEWGAKGYAVLVAKYGEHQVNLWRKRGGRKRNPTLAEKREMTGKQYPTYADLKAVSGPAGKRVKNKAAGSNLAATTTGEMPR